MFKNYLGFVPNVVHNLFTTNASIHDYNTRNKHKLRAAYRKHCFMYNNFRFVGTHIWNYIIDHLDIKVSLPVIIVIIVPVPSLKQITLLSTISYLYFLSQ